MQPRQISQARAIRELWRRADLTWKLHDGQTALYSFIQSIEARKKPRGVMRTSRRFGKTYALGLFAISKCLSRKNISFPFAAPTVKALKSIVLPQFQEILRDCPAVLRPQYRSQDAQFRFNNGSIIHLFGTDNGHAERIRGMKADYYVIDEAGFITDLKYLVNDILTPTLMYSDSGYGIISSTPPQSPDHYFVELLALSEMDQCAIRKTIWENPLLDLKQILEFAEATGCVVDWETNEILTKSISFRREFEAECLVDPEKAVIPEFTEEAEREIVVEWRRPEYCLKYVVIDTGFVDFTGIIFGYYDFVNAKPVVEDDMLINFGSQDMNIEELCKLILQKEKALWGDEKPYMRLADGDLIVLQEMGRYGCSVSPVRKDDLEVQVNQVRIDIAQKKLRIHPRAINVITHLKYAVWNKRRTQFERTLGHGHYDCLAALIYFLRQVNRQENPFPQFYNLDVWNSSALLSEPKQRNEGLKKLFIR